MPVALATDDYGVARSSHTLEWVKAVQEQALDYLTIKRMVRNSIEYAFVDQPTKARLKQALENAFHQFEQQEAATLTQKPPADEGRSRASGVRLSTATATWQTTCSRGTSRRSSDARESAGLERALVILAAGDEKESAQARRLEEVWPDVRFAIGVHPHQAHQFAGAPEAAADAVRRQFAETPRARAIGEIGLDYHYDFSPRDVQQQVFRSQVALARELRVPIVIHTREADEDTLAILREEGRGEVTGVLHCFTGGPSLARAGLDLGFYISLSGIVTFPKSAELRETLRARAARSRPDRNGQPVPRADAASWQTERAGVRRAGRRRARRPPWNLRGGRLPPDGRELPRAVPAVIKFSRYFRGKAR